MRLVDLVLIKSEEGDTLSVNEQSSARDEAETDGSVCDHRSWHQPSEQSDGVWRALKVGRTIDLINQLRSTEDNTVEVRREAI